MQYDASNPEEVKKAEQRERDERKRQLDDIRTLLSSSSGRRFVWRILEKCNSFSSVFSNDASFMAYNAGQQDLGHFLMAEITEANPSLLFKLMKEHRKETDD